MGTTSLVKNPSATHDEVSMMYHTNYWYAMKATLNTAEGSTLVGHFKDCSCCTLVSAAQYSAMRVEAQYHHCLVAAWLLLAPEVVLSKNSNLVV